MAAWRGLDHGRRPGQLTMVTLQRLVATAAIASVATITIAVSPWAAATTIVAGPLAVAITVVAGPLAVATAITDPSVAATAGP